MTPVLSEQQLMVGATQAARMLSISRTLFLSMASSGELGPKSVKFGRRRLWSVADLEKWIAADYPGRDRWVQMQEVKKEH